MFSKSLSYIAFSLACSVFAAALAGCDSHAATAATATAPSVPQGQSRAQVFEAVRQMTSVGEKIFFDPTLSGSGKLACASCHSPDHAFGPPNALSVQLGGSDMHRPGIRAVPSLK